MQVAKRTLDLAKEEGIPVEEALSALRSCPSSVDGFSPARLFYCRDLRHPELPAINDGLDEELLGKERQARKEESRQKRNSQVSKSIQRYTPKVGDLVFLQDRRTNRWDIPGTVQLVHPGGRSAYVLTEDSDSLYLRSHVFMRPRTVPTTDAVPGVDQALTQPSVSTNEADTATNEGSQHSLMKTVMTCSGAVPNSSMMRSDDRKPGGLSLYQLALDGDTEQPQPTVQGQSQVRRSRSQDGLFLPPM